MASYLNKRAKVSSEAVTGHGDLVSDVAAGGFIGWFVGLYTASSLGLSNSGKVDDAARIA